MLLLSKFVRCWRRITSSMRGCCHRPGVEGAGEGCCLGVDVCSVGVSFGRVVVGIDDGEAGFGCAVEGARVLLEEVERTRPLLKDGERTRLLLEEDERSRAVVVVDMAVFWRRCFELKSFAVRQMICCAVSTSFTSSSLAPPGSSVSTRRNFLSATLSR